MVRRKKWFLADRFFLKLSSPISLYFSQIISPSKAFANAYYYVQKGLASLDRIEEILHVPTDENKNAGTAITSFKSSIQFKDLSFGYDKTPILKGVNFEINKGERVALVGASGGREKHHS